MTTPPQALIASATVSTRSTDETREFAAALASVAEPGDRLALVGPLGAGKTQFAKGFAVGLGVAEVVNSPSFTLMAEYMGRLPLFHQDLYRLTGAEEVMAGGMVDERQLDGVTLSESCWPTKAYQDAAERESSRGRNWPLNYASAHAPLVAQGAFDQHAGTAVGVSDGPVGEAVVPNESLQPEPAGWLFELG